MAGRMRRTYSKPAWTDTIDSVEPYLILLKVGDELAKDIERFLSLEHIKF